MKTNPLHFLAVAVITALVFSGIALAISALDPSQGTTGPENNSHSDAELDDLQFVATEMGITLQETIARYSWNDDFSRIVSDIRDASPQDFAGAAIAGDTEAWVAFAGQTPSAAQGIVDTFSTNFPGVSVELRTDLGFTEQEIGNAIAGAHYAVFESAGVLDAASSFDHETRQISVTAQTGGANSVTVLGALQRAAENGVTRATRADMLDFISVSVAVVQHSLGAEDS